MNSVLHFVTEVEKKPQTLKFLKRLYATAGSM